MMHWVQVAHYQAMAMQLRLQHVDAVNIVKPVDFVQCVS